MIMPSSDKKYIDATKKYANINKIMLNIMLKVFLLWFNHRHPLILQSIVIIEVGVLASQLS